ncbi:hypothetical protein [Streptomyces sp. NBC_00996]|uniref:Rv1733c family protein n=1 Tax=Streptomyces sp. NBC_00996 TaxID=2903710 RepID=UPI003869F809|nr:hypothetical protein OG390_36915 [Streptomyces sp. NBC_00996]
MRRTKCAGQLLWRWRSNPLRRHNDVVEAWIILVVWTVIALGGTLVGVMAGHAADESFGQLRHERHSVSAVLVENTARIAPTAEGTAHDWVRATVRWTTPDGSTRTGRALVDSGHRAGSRVVIWLDSGGRPTTEPPTAWAAAFEAGMLGAGAAAAFAGLAFATGRVAQWRLDQRRYAEWGREWDRLGAQGGRKTT